MNINLNNITLEVIPSSIFKTKMSDEEYFSERYKDYISNSRLKNIDPEDGGSMELYKNPPKITSSSLDLGSAIHQLVLQPDEFILNKLVNKPSYKLALVIDKIKQYRKEFSIYDSISKACNDINYYTTNKNQSEIIKKVVKGGYQYYLSSLKHPDHIFLSESQRITCNLCVNNLLKSKSAKLLLHPKDSFGDSCESYNEEAFFISFNVKYGDMTKVIKLKAKLDNWTINTFDNIVVLNDLKTTGKYVHNFMNDSFIKYNYNRQLGGYLYILCEYLKLHYDITKYTFKTNILAVETIGLNKTKVFPINPLILANGYLKFKDLIKMVGYYELTNYENEVTFHYD